MMNTVKFIADIGVRSSLPFLHQAMVRENFTVYAEVPNLRPRDDKDKDSHRRTRKGLVKKRIVFNNFK